MIPNAPSNLLGVVKKRPSLILLSWNDNSSDETGFVVYRRTNNEAVFTPCATIGPNVTSYADTNVVQSVAYFYYVVAENADGQSPPSNTVGPLALLAQF